ncbi:hypothetical protein F4818DRAFT_441255 [Hypoxylon cercidicola]|nr:hypothetical protein F4818DRAFT_441255 [Hypoxylon cercidicola]
MRLHLSLLFLIGVLVAYVTAASAPTFCKCTCFKNSTLIQLGPQSASSLSFSDSSSRTALRSPPLQDRAASASCTQCTRAFCLSQHLPICKDAEENDVLTMCFQRDSRKDQIIVWGFILGTIGLLGWAAAKRVIEMREGKKAAVGLAGSRAGAISQDRGVYVPVGDGNAQGPR